VTTATATAIATAARPFEGTVHRPGDPGYEELRRPLDPALDPRPDVVVEALTARDVQAAVLAARDRGLPVAVQATGHGGRVAYRGGVLVSTAAMSSVLVDPDRRIGRIGPGARWADVIAAAAPFGLAPVSGNAPDVGVTGFTLGGGLSWLSRLHGFAADNVLRAEVVTADGRLVVADRDRHADLFWALRGGGGGFGIVTSLELRLHPVERVYAGTSYFFLEQAAETLAVYRDWVDQAPRELSTAVLLTQLDGRPALALRLMHAGSAEEAERLIAPLRAAAGPALADGFRETTYAGAAMGGTPPRHLDLVDDLPDAAIDFFVEAVADDGIGAGTIEIRHWGGAIADGDGPVGGRDTRFSAIADSADPALAETLRPHATGGKFLNFLADTTATERAYAPRDLPRLRAIRAAYDPDDVFRLGHAVR
jgi:FAD/FMN-containing dehydrogenase